MLKRQHQLFVTLMCVADGAVIALACYAAWAVRRIVNEGFFPRSWENWTIKEPLVVFAVPIGLLALGWFGLYRARRDRPLRTEWWQVFRASVLVTATTLVLVWLVGNDALISGDTPYHVPVIAGIRFHPGRVQFGCLAIALPLVLASHRTAVRFVLRAARRRGHNLRHVAIVGVGRLGQIVARTLDRNSWTGLHVNYFVSHHPQTRRTACLARPVLGGLNELERALRDRPVDAVYIALPNAVAAALPEVLHRLEKFAVDVRIVPDVHPRFVAQSMVVNELDGMPILSYRENLSTGVGGVTKRVLDLAGAAAALLLFSPLMVAIAMLIRVTSPGPVIFKQQRVSIGARTFKIYKFRTMYHVEDEQGQPSWTTRADSRVTRVGRWLRRTSLDELPQLLNVLRGDMSLVGPRPERPELIEQFRENWRGYLLRQHVKAGMTGWAQVNGHRGDTGVRKRLQYDLFYIKHWSLAFDLRILWLTVFRGFVHRNAH